MKLSVVTVAVNYTDYLAWTILFNRHMFDEWIIVTNDDPKVKQMCAWYNIKCIQTQVFYEDGGFNKFKGINLGIKALKHKDWILFLDADICLPPISRYALENLSLDKKKIYGIDRVNIKGQDNLIRMIQNPDFIVNNWLVDLSKQEVGSRIVHYRGTETQSGFQGWKPLGFFQLCHYSSPFSKSYPDTCPNADHCDMVFASQWERSDRELIPEIVGFHLESLGTNWGDNWKGRKTLPFNEPPNKPYNPPTPYPSPLPWIQPNKINPYDKPVGDFPFNDKITVTYGNDV